MQSTQNLDYYDKPLLDLSLICTISCFCFFYVLSLFRYDKRNVQIHIDCTKLKYSITCIHLIELNDNVLRPITITIHTFYHRLTKDRDSESFSEVQDIAVGMGLGPSQFQDKYHYSHDHDLCKLLATHYNTTNSHTSVLVFFLYKVGSTSFLLMILLLHIFTCVCRIRFMIYNIVSIQSIFLSFNFKDISKL